MSAVVVVQESNGAVVALNTVTNVRFNCSDSYAPALTYANRIPDGGIGNLMRSWWKHICLYFTGAFTQIDNIKVFCDGTIGWTLGTSGLVQVGIRDAGDNGCPQASYQQAVGTTTTGVDIDAVGTGHAYYKDQTATPADITNYIDGAELTLDTTSYIAAGVSKFLVMQLILDGDATLGAQSAEVITCEYDEI